MKILCQLPKNQYIKYHVHRQLFKNINAKFSVTTQPIKDTLLNPAIIKTNNRIKLLKSSLPQFTSQRFVSGKPPQGEKFLPPLMANIPFVWWSSFFGQIKVRFQLKSLKKIDPEFDMMEFLEGAHKALTVISAKLSNKDMEGMDKFIVPTALAEIKHNLIRFTGPQSQALLVTPDDAYVSFPYRIKITKPRSASHTEIPQNLLADGHIVEIHVVFHVWRGITPEEVRQSSFRSAFKSENVEKYLICNYIFERDYTDSSSTDSQWDVTALHYFCGNPSPTSRNSRGAHRNRPRSSSKRRSK